MCVCEVFIKYRLSFKIKKWECSKSRVILASTYSWYCSHYTYWIVWIFHFILYVVQNYIQTFARAQTRLCRIPYSIYAFDTVFS